MIQFLIKGLIRDRHRSLFPIIVVTMGVMLTTLFYGFITGMIGDAFKKMAIFDTGHVKVMSRAYADIIDQMPNDLALSGAQDLIGKLARDYPDVAWAPRIKFGGLLDFPDESGETRSQGPFVGIALDMLNNEFGELERLGLADVVVEGRLPLSPGEVLISAKLAEDLEAAIGDTASLVSVTANGGMAVHNFTLVGTIAFGINMMDRNLMLADLFDIQYALDMEDAAGEILGLLPNNVFDRAAADRLAGRFNAAYKDTDDEFVPTMITFRDQHGMGEMMDFVKIELLVIVFFFVFVMSIVLWNSGLMSGLRRYGEMGVRLAMGEPRGHVYRSLIYESVAIGIAASVIGTAIGMALVYWLQETGLDMTRWLRGGGAQLNIAIANVIRTKVSPEGFFIGFVPGLFSTVLGTLISGIGIFKRQTSTLFKELEV